MRKPITFLASLMAALLGAHGVAQLAVIRVSPTDDADPRADITVTFDRPVSGGLDAIVDPARVFRIEPAVRGRLEWRDPVTLRFVPAAPLTAGATYRVTITTDFEAMDGTRLARQHEATIRVAPPRVLVGEPIGRQDTALFIPARPILKLLISSPPDVRLLAERSHIALSAQCGGARIPVEVVRVRRITDDDSGTIRYTGGYYQPGDSARDLRRVVELRPQSDLPRACSGVLNVPAAVTSAAPLTSWHFRTYGPLELTAITCAWEESCPNGPIRVTLTTPVRGAELLRNLRVVPAIPITIDDTSRIAHEWIVNARLEPRKHYTVQVNAALTDVFGQRMAASQVGAFITTSYTPNATYEHGKLLVERQGLRTLPVQVVNVDTLVVTTIRVPHGSEAAFLSQTWRWAEPFDELRALAVERRIVVTAPRDQPRVVGVPVPTNDATRTADGTLIAMRVRPLRRTKSNEDDAGPIALLQVTDLAVHGRMALDGGIVWVTGVRDGRPRAGAIVTLYDATGKVRSTARTDEEGIARFSELNRTAAESCGDCRFDGYVAARFNDDRAVVGFNAWDPDFAAWQFGVSGAWSTEQRIAAAAAVFTERGIYRPGERVYAKAIVRNGTLGTLTVPRGDSLKWVFTDRESGVLRETVTALSGFGTADQSLALSTDMPLGEYGVHLSLKREGEWRRLASTSYQVAEYRPPEFLVDVNADPAPRFAGDTVPASISARYLFGAPMAGARVRWVVQHRPLGMWELDIPGVEGWEIGGYDGDDDYYYDAESVVVTDRVDSLDARGTLEIRAPMPVPAGGRPARTGILAVVTDANRQTVSAGRSIIVHPSSFYIAAKPRGRDYFWRAGTPVELDVMAVHPGGDRMVGIDVQGVVIRREWHRARRIRDGQISEVGGWVSDTVATCRIRTEVDPATCRFTPAAGGSYMVALSARDARGRLARTTVWRWAAGAGFVPWRDAAELRMEIIPDRQRYSVGDTATLLLASPFTNVEAWLTIERERVLESRRIRITAGATTIRVPITEALAPNAYVSVLLVRGRTGAPGPLDDPGRPAVRVGYVELNVVPAVKQLTVKLAPQQPEYRPGDTARVNIAVTDADGRGQRAEVTLWAVDEGVLALTGYQTPDPVELLYQARPLGVRLSSNLARVAAQIPEGQKGNRAPGGGGGGDVAGVLRSRFQTTAFFLGSVVTDANGVATASARLPDNLTTFRIMAVAVTAGDRYGSGSSSMLVTRPLVARAALPRFVREGDRFTAGVVINQRTGGTQRVDVEATARGIALSGARRRTETLTGAAPREVRFDFTAQAGDSAWFEFGARGPNGADAVAVRVPVRPSYHPLAQTIAGAVRDTASAVFQLEQQVDPARSTLEISFGSSTLAVIRGARSTLRVYPYYCTEQIASTALPLIALHRAQKELGGTAAPVTAEEDIRTAVRMIARRQSYDGGIGYWSPNDWSTPWLSSYAARVLIEARDAGFDVDQGVLDRLADYLERSLHDQTAPRHAVAHWHADNTIALGERVAAVDLLSRLGRPNVPMENTLFGNAANLRWEDRVQLAETLARRGAQAQARTLLTAAWRSVTPSGRTLVVPAAQRHYFESDARPAARLLTATLAVEPQHPQLGALVETLVTHGRAAAANIWNTQDYGNTVLALMAFERRRQQAPPGTIRIDGARGTLLTRTVRAGEARDTSIALTNLVSGNTVTLRVTAESAAPIYYYLTIREVPRVRPVRPVDRGIQVERWYERVDNRAPVTRVAAGELVRVRLRITVPQERHFVVLDDPLPAGLEAVDLSLRTVQVPGFNIIDQDVQRNEDDDAGWYFGSWDAGVWSPFDHKELRDDRVVYFATVLWKGTYTATYLARATTEGTFAMPPAHAEEMYNPAVNGRTGGGEFIVTPVRR